jgi:hypothetical protein
VGIHQRRKIETTPTRHATETPSPALVPRKKGAFRYWQRKVISHMDDLCGVLVLFSACSLVNVFLVFFLDIRAGPDWYWRCTHKWHFRRAVFDAEGAMRISVKVAIVVLMVFMNAFGWIGWHFGIFQLDP